MRARAGGSRVSMHSTGLPPGWLAGRWAEVLESLDVLVLQRESLGAIPDCPVEPESAAGWLAARASATPGWPTAVIVSCGHEGAALIEPSGHVAHAEFPSAPVIDATGSSDALVGVFLALWLHGVPPSAALAPACAAARLVATRLGAQELRPSAADLAAFLPLTAGVPHTDPRQEQAAP